MSAFQLNPSIFPSYSPLARSLARQEADRAHYLTAELMALRHNESIHNEIERRRQFHNFVSDRVVEQKIAAQLESEGNHLEYLARIDRLRKQRQHLGRQRLLERLDRSQTHLGQTLIRSELWGKNIVHDSPNRRTPHAPPRNSQSMQYMSEPRICIENERVFTPSYKLKSQHAREIAKKWVPHHLLQKEHSGLEQEKLDNQKYLSQIEQQMAQIRNRANQHLNKSAVLPSQDLSRDEGLAPKDRNRSIKHVSFIDHQQQPAGNQTKKSPDPTHLSPGSLKRSWKQNSSSDRLSPKEQHFAERESGRKRKVKKSKKQRSRDEIGNSGVYDVSGAGNQRIKNRLDLSMVVYEDSEHRTINHEKTHLANKFQNQCRIRKALINNICSSKAVEQKYRLLVA